MALKISTGLTLTTDYFMRNFYMDNRNVSQKNGRNGFSNIELSFEDSRALSRASKRMLASSLDSEKDDEDINETMQSQIEAFVNTYNNALDTADTDDYDTENIVKQMKSLTKQYSGELSDIGITIEKGGKLSVNTELLKMADTSKVRKVFSSESEYTKKSLSLSKKLNSAVQNNLFSQVSGKGLRVNITL